MVRKVDTSSLNNPDNFTDWGEYFLTQARQRKAQDQALDMQRQTAQMAQQKFDLERQQFEADKAAAASGQFTGNSIQAQIGNRMRQLGYSDDQILSALTMQGIPLPNGGYATYSRSQMVGPPAAGTGTRGSGLASDIQSALKGQQTGMDGPVPRNAPAPTPPMPGQLTVPSGNGVNVLVPGIDKAQQEAQANTALQNAKDARLLQNRMSAIQSAEQLLSAPGANPTESYGGMVRNTLQKEFGLGGQDERDLNAKLNVLAGFLTSSVPRMEGPQSNIDVEFYKDMAGRVGDQTATISERLAALKALRDISEKYSGNITAQAPDMAAPPSNVQNGPAVGDMVEGYVYKGGDPANPSSWGQVR